MYLPPLNGLPQEPRLSKDNLDTPGDVTIPKAFFKFLIQAALSTTAFDDRAYLDANPDVADAIGKGGPVNAKQHFIGYGYFEGRAGALPKVDEAWYLQTYPDVAAAVMGRKVKSAQAHFQLVGASEGRAPSKQYQDVANFWKKLATGSQS